MKLYGREFNEMYREHLAIMAHELDSPAVWPWFPGRSAGTERHRQEHLILELRFNQKWRERVVRPLPR